MPRPVNPRVMELKPAMSADPPKKSTLWQKLVGLFVAWQLVFLVGNNALAFLPLTVAEEGELTDSRGPLPGEVPDSRLDLLKEVNRTFVSYSHLTGQVQAWWLFAPSFPPDGTFPLVTLHWNHGEFPDVDLHSRQEPQDPNFYIRWPGSSDRLFHYEMRLGLVGAFLQEESLRDHADEWRDLFKERVGRQWKSIRAYLRWRTEAYLQDHPGLPMPDQITLSILAYETPRPGMAPPVWSAPLRQPLARWQPARDNQKGQQPVEYFDQVRKSFETLASKE